MLYIDVFIYIYTHTPHSVAIDCALANGQALRGEG